jgi:hypothetical protein
MICVTCKYKIFQDCQFDVEDVRYRNESKVHGCCCHDHSPRRVDTASLLALNTGHCVTLCNIHAILSRYALGLSFLVVCHG